MHRTLLFLVSGVKMYNIPAFEHLFCPIFLSLYIKASPVAPGVLFFQL